MGTRGSYGFRVGEVDKLSYNHFDSYPDCLGNTILKFIRDTNNDELKEIAGRVVLVSEDATPTAEQIEVCKGYLSTRVGLQTEDDWYCLLREAQGNPEALKEGLDFMLDSGEFIYDSLFCQKCWVVFVSISLLCCSVVSLLCRKQTGPLGLFFTHPMI